MTWKTHLIGGVTAGATAALLYQQATDTQMTLGVLVLALGVSGIAALLPDVDEINSKAGRILLPISLVFYVVQTIIKILTLFTFGSLKRRIRENTSLVMHRGICHYPITIIMVSAIAYIIVVVATKNKYLWVLGVTAFTIGLLSHIILDIISGKIALLFPLSKKRYGVRIFESGGILETVIARPALLVLCVVITMRIVG